jgi:selenocysteine lyase/cysteine desulfurase
VNSIEYHNYETIDVLLSTYEHHSNFLPWIEIGKQYTKFRVWIIPLNDCGINTDYIENKIKHIYNPKGLIIVSVTACSNVTGVITDIDTIYTIIKKYNQTNNIKLFADCATLAPYKKINCSKLNGMFISGHKFIGGTGTPGILIADKNLFSKSKPFIQGGGCIEYANEKTIEYAHSLEEREMAGTPNIVGIIRLNKVFDIFNANYEEIENKETLLTKYVYGKFNEIHKRNSKLNVLFPMCELNKRLPIVSFYIKGVHFNLITAILSDYYGIQVRGGVACCGMLGNYLSKTIKINGWCRITFSWYMTNDEVDYILKSVEEVTNNIEQYKNKYTQDAKTNLFIIVEDSYFE